MADTSPFTWLTKGDKWFDGEKSGVSYAEDFWQASVDQMELSGTGFEEVVFEAVHEYLKYIAYTGVLDAHGVDQRKTLLSAKQSADVCKVMVVHEWFAKLSLAAELASIASFTNYGVSMRTAWVDDAGKAWMADYEKWKAEQKP